MMPRERKISVKEFHDPGEDIKTLYATTGDSPGEIDLGWDALMSARSYVVQYCVQSDNKKNAEKWQHIDIVTESCCTVSGLKTGKTYGFRVAHISNTGQGKWCEPVFKKITY